MNKSKENKYIKQNYVQFRPTKLGYFGRYDINTLNVISYLFFTDLSLINTKF